MTHCPNCKVDVKGDWETCPLCGTPLQGESQTASPYPRVPLRFDKLKGTKILMLVSVLIIFATFLISLIWQGEIQGLQGALFGIVTMWLVVLIIIRKRRNLAKSILYVLIALSLVCTYLDYLIGWTAWSTTYAIPIICGAALLAMFVAVRFTKMKTGDYVLYILAAAVLGLVPTLFLFFDWVYTPIPAWISITLSIAMLIIIFVFQGREIKLELQKRMFI